MKNLFYGAAALLAFAVAFLLVEASCKKSNAQPTGNTNAQLNKIIFAKHNPTTANPATIWLANYDGSGATQVPVSLPPGAFISTELYTFSLRLSPDGQKVFFGGVNPSSQYCIYSCNVDGSNLAEISTATATSELIRLGGAY